MFWSLSEALALLGMPQSSHSFLLFWKLQEENSAKEGNSKRISEKDKRIYGLYCRRYLRYYSLCWNKSVCYLPPSQGDRLLKCERIPRSHCYHSTQCVMKNLILITLIRTVNFVLCVTKDPLLSWWQKACIFLRQLWIC